MTTPKAIKKNLLSGMLVVTHLLEAIPIIFLVNWILITVMCQHCLGKSPYSVRDCRPVETSAFGATYLGMKAFNDYILAGISLPLLILGALIAAPVLTVLIQRNRLC